MELITRQIINDFEGDPDKNLKAYATTGTPEYNRLVAEIAAFHPPVLQDRGSYRQYRYAKGVGLHPLFRWFELSSR